MIEELISKFKNLEIAFGMIKANQCCKVKQVEPAAIRLKEKELENKKHIPKIIQVASRRQGNEPR